MTVDFDSNRESNFGPYPARTLNIPATPFLPTPGHALSWGVAAWNDCGFTVQAGLVRAPEADKRPKGKGHEDSVLRCYLCGVQDMLPGIGPPLPVRRCIHNDEWFSGGAARTVQPRVSPKLICVM